MKQTKKNIKHKYSKSNELTSPAQQNLNIKLKLQDNVAFKYCVASYVGSFNLLVYPAILGPR